MMRIRTMIALFTALLAALLALAPHAALAQPRIFEGKRIEPRRAPGEHTAVEEERQREAIRRALGRSEHGLGEVRVPRVVRSIERPERQLTRAVLEQLRREAAKEATAKAAEEQVKRILRRPPPPLGSRAVEAAALRSPPPPPGARTPEGPRAGYAAVAERVAAFAGRLQGNKALVMDAADFQAAEGRLEKLAQETAPATASTATVDFDGHFAVVHLKDRLEVVRVEVPPAKLSDAAHRVILEDALRDLVRMLGEHADRVRSLVWSEASRRYEPSGIIAPRESRRDQPPRARVAAR